MAMQFNLYCPIATVRQRLPLVLLAILTAVLAACAAPLSRTAVAPPNQTAALEALGQLPLSFIPNQGQTDPQAQFYVNSLGGTLFFTPEELVLALPHRVPDNETVPPPDVLRVQFEGIRPDVRLSAGQSLGGTVNYLIGSDPARWRANIPTYVGLSYTDLYPRIDLRYEGTEGNLKSTYIVTPGADPARIRWRYSGADQVSIEAATGDLLIT